MKKKKIIPYNPKLKSLARQLRKNSTLSEVLLWNKLKKKQRMGCDFDRQRPIDEYIVDFFCSELMLAIEIDGVSHHFNEEKDKQRQRSLEKLGVNFLRFSDLKVKNNMESVVAEIDDWISDHQEKTVAVFGVFDGLHPGHEYFLQQAKQLGDELHVVLTRDVNVVKQKGQAPKHNEQERQQAMQESGLADKVTLGKTDLSYDIVTEIQPDVIVLGYDQAVDEEKLGKIYSNSIERIDSYKPEKYKSSKLNKITN